MPLDSTVASRWFLVFTLIGTQHLTTMSFLFHSYSILPVISKQRPLFYYQTLLNCTVIIAFSIRATMNWSSDYGAREALAGPLQVDVIAVSTQPSRMRSSCSREAELPGSALSLPTISLSLGALIGRIYTTPP